MLGAILGTYFGKGGNFDVVLPLPSRSPAHDQVDILNRSELRLCPQADRYAEAGDVKGFERMMVWTSHMIWGFSRAIPVFLRLLW
jgi:PTS system mannose-specific IIC component